MTYEYYFIIKLSFMDIANIDNEEGCYLLQTEIDRLLNNNRYKIGRSNKLNQRLSNETSYRHATIIKIIYCKNSEICEQTIIRNFKIKFNNITSADSGSYGAEYFEGDVEDIKNEFESVCNNHILTIESKEVIVQNQEQENINEDINYEHKEIKLNSNIKTTLIHASNGEEIIRFEYKDIRFDKMFKSDLFYLQSVASSMGKAIHSPKLNMVPFINSYSFYCQLCLLDPTLPKYSNVYLKFTSVPKTVKIGKCYDLLNEPIEQNEKLIKIVPVKDDSTVEQKLIISEFSKVYEKENDENETFIYNNLNQVKVLFNSCISESDKVKLGFNNSKHIQKIVLSHDNYHGVWISPQVVRILINNYVEDSNVKKDYDDIMDSLNAYISNDDYTYTEHNDLLNQDCSYRLCHKYVVIQNNDDLMVNGSRLWNSICETENKKFAGKSLSRFLKSKRIQKIKEQFNRNYPNKSFHTEKIKNIKQPQFNGVYIHHVLVQYIIEYLDTKRARLIMNLINKQFGEK